MIPFTTKESTGKLLQWVSTEVIVKNKAIDFFSMKSAAWWHREGRRDRGKERAREIKCAKSEGFVSVKNRQLPKFNGPVMFTDY